MANVQYNGMPITEYSLFGRHVLAVLNKKVKSILIKH